jgi:hypothetical protein
MGRACSTNELEEEYMQVVGGKTRWKETMTLIIL